MRTLGHLPEGKQQRIAHEVIALYAPLAHRLGMFQLKSELENLELNQVFVFTPAGEVKPLPAGSTPLDFAFAVHTDIGYSCVGAHVNNKMVRLDYQLKSGDICKIITKRGSLPKKDWLMFVKTARARSKIRHYLREKGIVA